MRSLLVIGVLALSPLLATAQDWGRGWDGRGRDGWRGRDGFDGVGWDRGRRDININFNRGYGYPGYGGYYGYPGYGYGSYPYYGYGYYPPGPRYVCGPYGCYWR